VQISIAPIQRFFPELSDLTLAQLQHFCALICTKNENLNLISRKDIGRIVEAHLLPSLAIFKKAPFAAGNTVLDIGTGGGLPGLPLAMTMPSVHFTLIDSVGKKIRAVEEFVSVLGLNNVTCINGRAESLRPKYHHAIGRAVAPIDTFYAWAKPCLKPNGKIFYLTGGEITPVKNRAVIDLFDLYDRQFCETKKLLIMACHGALPRAPARRLSRGLRPLDSSKESQTP
jgi:16S rRNA (guanine527-N7)-methyltransferase